MSSLGTALTKSATKVLLCGSGELGKEVAIAMQRFGVEVIAVDRYENAPAMQVAHRSYTVNMLEGKELRAIIEKENPDYIVPEVEAIATTELVELEKEGFTVIPTARAAWLTMNREGIRRLAAEELGLPTSPYRFAADHDEYIAADLGHASSAGLCTAVNGSTFTDVDIVADLHICDLAVKLEILRHCTDHRTREDTTVLAHLDVVEDRCMRKDL